MTYTELKTQRQNKYNELSNKVGLFFAFSMEQFNEGKKKYPLREGEKYVSIGAGGYIRKNDLNLWLDGMKEIDAWFKVENKKIKQDKKEREKAILYELNNYEAFYQCDITDAFEILKNQGYTRKEVLEVYNKHKASMNE